MEKQNILIVEDEIITALDIQMRLKKHGYSTVDYVTTGEEAIKMIKDQNVDLVLMDIKLKGVMDGISTAKLIIKKYSIPIIYISGNTDKHMLYRLRATKPVGIIAKPIKEGELLESVDGIIKYHKKK